MGTIRGESIPCTSPWLSGMFRVKCRRWGVRNRIFMFRLMSCQIQFFDSLYSVLNRVIASLSIVIFLPHIHVQSNCIPYWSRLRGTRPDTTSSFLFLQGIVSRDKERVGEPEQHAKCISHEQFPDSELLLLDCGLWFPATALCPDMFVSPDMTKVFWVLAEELQRNHKEFIELF